MKLEPDGSVAGLTPLVDADIRGGGADLIKALSSRLSGGAVSHPRILFATSSSNLGVVSCCLCTGARTQLTQGSSLSNVARVSCPQK